MGRKYGYTLKLLLLFLFGGLAYFTIEVLWRGHSHWTMFVLGGIIFLLLDGINEFLSWETPLWIQGLIGTAIIYVLEFVTGCVVNLWLGWQVWDYSDKPYNLLGQICPQMFLWWFLLSLVGIVLGDVIRWKLLGEEKPRYNLF